MTFRIKLVFAVLTAFSAAAANADSGFYAGGGVGNAGVEVDFTDAGFNIPEFDEDEFAWKVMAGYNLELVTFDVGVELGYVNFGKPSADILGVDVDFDTTGIHAFGIAGFDVGPLGVYGKLGLVSWDIEATIEAQGLPAESLTDDGTDLAFGAGVRFGIGALEVRGEYEVYDIEDTERVGMASASLVYYFN